MRSNAKRLEAKSVHGYRVARQGDTGNEEFEAKVNADSILALLSGHMLFVWNGNHQLIAWR